MHYNDNKLGGVFRENRLNYRDFCVCILTGTEKQPGTPHAFAEGSILLSSPVPAQEDTGIVYK